MHNIDRTVGEYHNENYEFGHEFGHEMHEEFGHEFGHEMHEEFGHEFGHEMHEEFGHEFGHEMHEEFGHEMHEEFGHESPFNEMMEEELATELLGISNEQELEQFLGKLFKNVVRGVKNFANSGVGRALGGVLKTVAKKALPIAGTALGGMFGGPIGAKIGGSLGNFAGKAFGLELEGLSAEDREYEVARAFVRFAGDAARRSARHPMAMRNAPVAARQSLTRSARAFAPGLLVPRGASVQNNFSNGYAGSNNGIDPMTNPNVAPLQAPIGRSGRWVRRGNNIVIYNIY
ncbi:MAG: hypothetical protein RLZZ292_311 [Bacteroidota bacterium]|jgi:hypothetical protein